MFSVKCRDNASAETSLGRGSVRSEWTDVSSAGKGCYCWGILTFYSTYTCGVASEISSSDKL